jgi:NADH-quinone oxidoreductase subunit C
MIPPSDWRSGAEALRTTHPVFDHLGAREVEPGSFEVWLEVRSPQGHAVRQVTRITADEVLPSLADLWAGAAWCEREASEGYDLRVGATALLLLAHVSDRGVLRRERLLPPRQQPWPGSHEPSGRSRMTPLGRG